jgi:hypothetical protein
MSNIGSAAGKPTGYFTAELYVVDASGNKQKKDALPVPATIAAGPGEFLNENHTLSVQRTPGQIVETYLIYAGCALASPSAPFGSAESWSQPLTAIMDIPQVGSLTFDYIPVSIVYCPPNQDMTASLTNSQNYGTRMTIGSSADFIGLPVQQALQSLGMTIGTAEPTFSQSLTNSATNSIELSYFRETVLTADNQRSIGRAYWGPLSDLFVLAKDSKFTVHQLPADSKFYYVNKTIADLVILPAHKLLRPGNDPTAKVIADSTRRQLLQLDPFITNLDQFFPDSGAALSVAVNSSIDPSANNRAQLLGRWWLNNGTELNYSIGEKKELKMGEATEVKFFPGSSVFGVDLSSVFGAAQAGKNYPVTVGLQSSKETLASTSQSAACFLMRNQNEKDLSGIAIYYDKIFSTLMFAPAMPLMRRVSGVIKDRESWAVAKVPVTLTRVGPSTRTRPRPGPVPPGPLRFETMTDEFGRYEFLNASPGKYRLDVGEQTCDVEIEETGPEMQAAVEINVNGVRRILDLNKAAVWEVALALRISTTAVRRVTKVTAVIYDADDLASILQTNRNELNRSLERVSILWPQTELSKASEIQQSEIAQLTSAGISSLQQLWKAGHSSAKLSDLAKQSGIEVGRLRKIVAHIDASRVSKRTENRADRQ